MRRTAWRRVRNCATLGITSLVIGCAPLAAEPPPSTAAKGREQTEGSLARPAETRRREDVAQVGNGQWVRPVGNRQSGIASYYSAAFNGRRMANGRRFDPAATSVAHRTLPFGTTVLVTNRGNGRTAMATVEDRGPFIRGRILDMSPKLAERLGFLDHGIAPVEVTPVELAEAPD